MAPARMLPVGTDYSQAGSINTANGFGCPLGAVVVLVQRDLQHPQ